MGRDLTKRAAVAPQVAEKARDQPATIANCHGRQASFPFHVVGEGLNLRRVGADGNRAMLQTTQETEPACDERANPTVAGLAVDLITGDDSLRTAYEGERVDEHEQFWSVSPQGLTRDASISQFAEEGEAFFRQRACTMASYRKWRLEQMIEHSGSLEYR